MGHEPAAAPVTGKPVQVGADILDEYLEVVLLRMHDFSSSASTKFKSALFGRTGALFGRTGALFERTGALFERTGALFERTGLTL